ncbi:hypothetical protein bcgnr5416_15180 [Bacillus cereus]|nr:hypothetical protein BCJMU07_0814 [Bacillus cereus]BCC75135.1 hypothetical protein BCJMU62_0826 [Bacillus cereus]
MFQRNERYQRFFEYIYRNLQYINDFSNISIITQNISTIRQEISTYRQIMTLQIKEDCSKMEQSLPFYSAPSAVAILSSKFSLDNSAAIKSAVSGSAKCI